MAVTAPCAMSVEAVVLDMDGLMLDTERIYRSAWQRAAAELGYTLDDAGYARLAGRPIDDCERDLLTRFGAGFPLTRFRGRWPELWRAATSDGVPAKPGLFDLLDFAEARGLPVAVATSSDADYTELSLRQAGLAGRFRVIVTADQVERGKPAPDIYIEAARRMGIAPSRCVALEDSEAGVVSASAAGMIPVLVPDMISPSDAALDAAAWICRSLDDARRLVGLLIANDPAR